MGVEAEETTPATTRLPASIVTLHEPELVFPSRTTGHDENYFLCNLDQNLAVVMQTVYFFKGDSPEKPSGTPAQVIRESLAELLVWYYPLAGRFSVSQEGKLEVFCNGQGALFVEADSDVTLAEFAQDSSLGECLEANLSQFVSSVPDASSILDIPPLIVQVTTFKCGGFVLGLSNSHAIMDGIGAMEFVNSWTEIARGVPLSVPPNLDRSILKARQPPQIDSSHPEFHNANDHKAENGVLVGDAKNKLVFKSITFDEEWLSTVRQSITGEGLLDKQCSCFEAFSAMVWRCRTLALEHDSAPENRIKLLFAVDIRNKLQPPLPRGYVGNGILLTCALTTVRELTQSSLSRVVELIRGAIRRIDDSYIRSVIDYYEQTRLRPSLESTLVITTWSRLAFHTTDFGWGTPCFTAPASLPEPEVALFLPKGRGFNLVLGLPETAMDKFIHLMEQSRDSLRAAGDISKEISSNGNGTTHHQQV